MMRAVRLILVTAAAAALLVTMVRLPPKRARSGFFSGAGSVRLQPQPVERGTLRLHYVQKPIGYERYQIVPRR